MRIALALLLAACTSDPPAPSCNEALTHYYGAGCGYADSSGGKIPLDQFITSCQATVAHAPSSCLSKIDDWNRCEANVPSPAKSNADCDCSVTQQALLACR